MVSARQPKATGAAVKNYHLAWLAGHPERDLAWLRDRLADGFHVHHVDGNHCNEAPENLVLIDGADHMRLHGNPGGLRGSINSGRKGGLARAKNQSPEQRKAQARRAAKKRWRGHQKPWKKAGVSSRTWYRRKAKRADLATHPATWISSCRKSGVGIPRAGLPD